MDSKTGQRVGECELSTIDTALLLAGVLTAAQYFDGDKADEPRAWADLCHVLMNVKDFIFIE